jgi:hypothetical protein
MLVCLYGATFDGHPSPQVLENSHFNDQFFSTIQLSAMENGFMLFPK